MTMNWNEFFDIVKTNLLIFIALFIITRILGKKQLSQLTYFNYVTGITIGSIAANGVNIESNSAYDNYISLACWGIFTLIIAILSMKLPLLKVAFEGEPAVVIKKGKVQKKSLQSLRLTMNDLLMLLRNKNVFNIKDVYYAVLEQNGKLSLLKEESAKQVTKKDVNANISNKTNIATSIIIDGNLIEKNLKEINVEKKWVLEQLKKQGIKNYKSVFYAQIQDDGQLYIDNGE